ncbi:MAG: valine--tRNA ligase [Phycisphaerales bacterium]|nr:MAG: valine--tRNA ligase [Phycisphaerales bacterium]
MTTTTDLPKQYTPADHEPRIWQRWLDANAFHADPDRVLNGEAPPYAVVIPPPNVTGALHLGHALNNTIQDVLVRAHRMMGYETIWLPGTDHAGIATQTVVDKRLKSEGKPALVDYKKIEAEGGNGREQFTAQVMAWKDEYEARITAQLQAMGCSCDWERQRFTMDKVCARAVREAFFRLFKNGLIYRGKRLVNWDPVTQTALADDEVEMHEVDGAFYDLRYPLVHPAAKGEHHKPVTWGELAARGMPGAEAHPDDEQAWVTVATTRPETYLGDVAVAVNPRDPRAAALRGLRCRLPIVGRIVPIIEDDYVVLPVAFGGPAGDAKAEMSTGFLKVTPAHDPNDYEIGRRHEAEIEEACSAGTWLINVMAPDATISADHGWTDINDAKIFLGKTREEARKLVISEFKARTVAEGQEGSLLDRTRPHRHSVGHSYRSHAVIEPYLSDQWYVKVTDDQLKGNALRAMAPNQRSGATLQNLGGTGVPPVTTSSLPEQEEPAGDGQLRFYPDRYSKTFESWHENLRDWCISRQLWWGHRIPVWSGTLTVDANTDPHTATDLIVSGLWEILHDDSRCAAAQVFDESGEPIALDDVLAIHHRDRTYQFFVCLDGRYQGNETALEDLGFVQDPDVLDTWFSSALWPLSTLGWPDPDQSPDTRHLLDAFNPTSVLCTAREIITLWVSRMVMFNRYFRGAESSEQQNSGTADRTARPSSAATSESAAPSSSRHLPGPLPFRDVFIHAMIQDGEGRKMSKSLGNGVDPMDIIASHGSDAMRFTLCHMTTQTQDVRVPVEPDPKTGKNTSPKFDLGRNFCNKLWNASRFTLSILHKSPEAADVSTADVRTLALADRWMLSRLTAGVRAAESSLAQYQFSAYATTLYDLLWRDFCDWYLEAIKPTVAASPQQRAVLRTTLDAICRLLHPVAPFITEAIHEQLRQAPGGSIDGIELTPPRKGDTLCTAGWPITDDALIDPEADAAFERARALVAAIREVRAQHQVPPKRAITLHCAETPDDETAALVRTLANVDTITADAPAGPSVAFSFEQREHKLSNLADAVDAGAERERLTKQIAELDKSIGALEGRLNNPGYAERAPAHLVEQSRAQLEQAKADRDAARAALDTLA